MQHPRFWRLRFKVLAFVPAAVVIYVVWFLVRLSPQRTALQSAAEAAPVAAAFIGLLSLVATAVSLAGNWQRQRREATINAWNAWSDRSRDDRRALSRQLGVQVMSAEQGRSLVEDPALSEELMAARRSLVNTLNGLERLAVGVEMGVYDLRTLNSLGGTIFVRQYERAESYIAARRSATDEAKRQINVYESLEYVCGLLRQGQLRDETRKIDQDRLAYLRRRRN